MTSRRRNDTQPPDDDLTQSLGGIWVGAVLSGSGSIGGFGLGGCARQREIKGEAMYDLIIKGGTIVDGTGTPCFRGDVAISQGRIAAVGTLYDSARQIIDAGGRMVAP